MNTIDIPAQDLDRVTRGSMQFWLYPAGGSDEAFRRTAIAENDQSDEWKAYRKLVVQVLAGLTMCGYTVNAPGAA